MTAGAIVDLSRTESPASITADVCVIGSGCGGATAAWDLAVAGRDVVVLEEGGDFTGTQLTQREGAMYDQLYMDRAGRATEDMAITVLQGRALGGGSVINMSLVEPIRESVLRHWQKKFGLTDFSKETLQPFVDQALRDLSVSQITDEQLNRANRLLKKGTEAIGLRGEVMRHNRVGCEGLGTCLIGCPLDAKRNARFVAIPAAIEAGARFYTRARAVKIESANDEIKRIRVRTLDPKGYHEQGELEVRAPVVIVAANAVATPQLLLRSGIGNEHVGRNLMLQPQLPIMALFDERVDAIDGIPQAYTINEHDIYDHPEHGLWGYRAETIMGTPGIVASMLPTAGIEGKKMMAQYSHFAASLLLLPDEPSGTVTLKSDGRPLIRYEIRDNLKERWRAAMKMTARAYLAAGAREILVTALPPLRIRSEADLAGIDAIGLEPATAPLLSAHQQGTVRFAPSAKDGAADPTGQVYGTRDVYVFDSSGYPSSASTHTMAPIITTSHYLTAQLISRS